MRLWHQSLIPILPHQQLLGQHRECCALRGNGWGRKHATVNYVFDHNPMMLVMYHFKIIKEMFRRGMTGVDKLWGNPLYRGKSCEPWSWDDDLIQLDLLTQYPEHNDQYLRECINNLKNKGIELRGA